MGKFLRVVLILAIGLVGGCSTPPDEEFLSFPTVAPSATPTDDSTSLGTATPDISPPSSILDYISASSIAISPNGRVIAAVNPDSNSISLINTSNHRILFEIEVGENPKTLSFIPDSNLLAVTNHDSATVTLLNSSSGNIEQVISVGAMPYGVTTSDSYIFVAEFALGNIGVYEISTGNMLQQIPVGSFPAGLAYDPRGHLYVTHLFSGNVTKINTSPLAVEAVASTGADTNLSQFISLAPDGTRAYLPQTRSNATNTALLFDTTVFPVVNVLELTDLKLMVRERITPDTADEPVNMPFALVLAPDGNRLYLANAGSNDISVIDLTTNQGIAHIEVGANPRGIAIDQEGKWVYVNNVLDGTISVIDTESLEVVNTIQITEIPVDPQIRLGKIIFNAARIPDLTTDGWISCGVCHFDGGMDGRTWLGFPDGPRNTPALFGVGNTLPIHWSGDLDELQDVELTIRNIQFGEGLVDGEAFDSLGTMHNGLSEELDALAAFMSSLEIPDSPYTSASDARIRGQEIFNSIGCDTCHTPPLFTDQQLHDVGTGDPSLEKKQPRTRHQF